MSFFGRSFIYDGIPSELYGLYIASIDSQAINSSMGSSAMDIYEQKIYRKSKPLFFGMSPSQKLQFDFSAFSEDEIDADTFSLIQKWLFSSRSYKRFAIDQIDIQNIYFNAIFNDPKIVRVGNLIKGFSCSVQCDSPFAWRYPATINYVFTESTVNATKVFNNESDDSGAYLYPSLVITMNNIAGFVTIINQNDDNRKFSFGEASPLSANEVLTIDCGNQIVSSSTGLKRLDKFNKKFLRLVPGVNTLLITGNVANIAMTTQYVVKKIGG